MRAIKLRWMLSTLLASSAFLICLLNVYIGIWHTAQVDSTSTLLPAIPQQHLGYQDERVAEHITVTGVEPLVRYHEPKPRPPLDSILQGEWNITGDPSWLLNFAIVGFPKCGTSTLMFHLQNHPQVRIFGDERCDNCFNQQAKLIHDLYEQFPIGDYARGIKCPMDLENTQLSGSSYNKFFPHTDFIVGIRHPVLWFESFYNFRIHNEFPMPPANELIGKCRRRNYNLCTFRSNFHIFLGNLGKTNFTTNPDEYQYVAPQYRRSISPLHYDEDANSTASSTSAKHRRIFLYEVSQLSGNDDEDNNKSDKNNVIDRATQFRVDLQHFLGLTRPIPPMIWFRPGRNHTSDEVVKRTSSKKIDICQDEYDNLRSVLMEQAVNASKWIRTYFVQSNDVFVSSKDYFVHTLMPSWERDPCIDRRIAQLQQYGDSEAARQ